MSVRDISTEELAKELNRRNASNPKRKRRYEITGTWSGYTSSQSRVCYRSYTDSAQYANSVKDLGYIKFSDGTELYLSVRELEYREKKGSCIGTYDRCLADCVKRNSHIIE